MPSRYGPVTPSRFKARLPAGQHALAFRVAFDGSNAQAAKLKAAQRRRPRGFQIVKDGTARGSRPIAAGAAADGAAKPKLRGRKREAAEGMRKAKPGARKVASGAAPNGRSKLAITSFGAPLGKWGVNHA
jgi:hypothetical protein